MRRSMIAIRLSGCLALFVAPLAAEEPSETRPYENRLTPIADPRPILNDHPEFVEPVREEARFEAPPVIDEEGADLSVRAWRFSYNARGIVEVPNRLRAERTAIVVVHPWGIDDGQSWDTPEPAGVAFQCTPIKNQIALDHAKTVINPFLEALRGRVSAVVYSLPGTEDPIRGKLYRSLRHRPTDDERAQAQRALEAKLRAFSYRGEPLPSVLALSDTAPVLDYFRQFPGLDAGPRFNNEGFWDQPIPVMTPIAVDRDDVVVYDAEGYAVLRDFLKSQGVRHVLLAGYNTDMCVISTTAGYQNLENDFNVFLVGDATLATFPANNTPRFATNAAVSFASLRLFITQVSWVKPDAGSESDPNAEADEEPAR